MTTALKIDRTTLRQIAAAVAFAMLVASIPVIGVTVMPNRFGAPCITADICHPLQSFCGASATISIARPAPVIFSLATFSEPAPEPEPASISNFSSAPDPPPPKRFA